MKECFHCYKQFDESLVQTQERADFILDENYNDIPIIRYLYLCPYCESWTE